MYYSYSISTSSSTPLFTISFSIKTYPHSSLPVLALVDSVLFFYLQVYSTDLELRHSH